METLYNDESGYAQFLVNITELLDHSISFEVYEVTGWSYPENTPVDTEIYIKGGYVKWDGCSTITFEDGLHLCGNHCWVKHTVMMVKLWEFITSKIKKFNQEVAS